MSSGQHTHVIRSPLGAAQVRGVATALEVVTNCPSVQDPLPERRNDVLRRTQHPDLRTLPVVQPHVRARRLVLRLTFAVSECQSIAYIRLQLRGLLGPQAASAHALVMAAVYERHHAVGRRSPDVTNAPATHGM